MTEVAVPLATAFVLGFLVQQVGLPPLVGYLAAGFVLAGAGFAPGAALDTIADLGVLLLLFGIGLKLKPTILARPVVWLGATTHMGLTVLVFAPVMLLLGAFGVPLLSTLTLGQAALLAFALAFSSTVFAVKALEEFNESSSLAGRVAIGTLVLQDIAAVVFLVAVGGVPSIWAVPVVAGVVLLRPLWLWLLDRTGYQELLLLLGLVLALGVGAAAFDAVGVKADLGALVAGMLVAGHPKAADLGEGLLGLKDVLLVGFFLSIGLGGIPGPEAVPVVVVLLALLPLKSAAHLLVLSRFGLRARTVWHSSVTLANYSEFGLIVVAVGVEEGLLDQSWAVVLAVLVAVSFGVASGPNRRRFELYTRHHNRLARLQRRPTSDADALIDPGDCAVLVFGMGRVGEGAYDELVRVQEGLVVGVDRSQSTVDRHIAEGRTAVRGDALDSDFWERMLLHPDIELVVLAMSDHAANLKAVRRIRSFLPHVPIAAVAVHADEVAALHAAGVDVARNLFEEAGQGLADDAVGVLPGLQVPSDGR